MNPFRLVLRRLRHLFRGRQTEADMMEEMRFHLDQRAAEYADDGLSEVDARFAAQRRFGNTAGIQEIAREDRGWGALDRAWKDVRFAFRQLRRSPGFTVLAVVTLGLGIGANTSMFSMLNGVLLKPLPYRNPGQLDRFYRATPQNERGFFSTADFLDFQRAEGGYGELAAYNADNASLSEPGQPAQIAYSSRATANLFALLGVTPQLGRDFRPDEGTPGRDRVVILSQRTWINRFGGRNDVIGQTVRVDGEPHQIIGVLPQSFNDWRLLGVIDLFRPLAVTSEQAADRQTQHLRVIGRRSAEHSKDDSAAFAANFGQRMAREHPDFNAGATWHVKSLQLSAAGPGALTVLPMLIGLSGFVLLIACSNLANLLLARTMARAREFAVRAALGASRIQLLRPLIAESVIVAIAGGGVALLVAQWFRDWAVVRSRGENGEAVFFEMDWHVAGWAFGAALVTALVFGMAPALFALRLDLNHTLKSGGRGMAGGRGHQRFRHFLIVGQFALAMVLLTGAGIFIRGLHDRNTRRAGWAADDVVTGNVLLPSATYRDDEKIRTFQRLAADKLRALPGVEAVSFSSATPIYDWSDIRRFIVEQRDRPERGREPAASVNTVSPEYFSTFDTRLVAGRLFRPDDDATAGRVYIVGQGTARALLGDGNPVGQRIAPVTDGALQWGEVVGVVQDIEPVDAEPDAVVFQVYQPMAQEPQRASELALRVSGGAPSALVDRIRALVAEIDPDLPIRRLQPADVTIGRVNYQLGVLRDLLTGMALLGLALAALGIYGVISRTMAQRSGEFAIRLALGACIRDLTRIVLTSGVKLALIGAAIGLVGAIGVSHVLGITFPGIDTSGFAVLVWTTLVLVGVALLACWLPARRAGKVDAMAVLRAE